MSEAKQIPTLCDECVRNANRHGAKLCAKCAQLFRVIVIPDDLRSWEEIEREAEGDSGTIIETYISSLLKRVGNQQRELSKLNRQLTQLTAELKRAHHGVKA